ncbi:MAG: tetratricopeptide repeat protein [Alphaproteobacteria bacterium]|nr:tetratricopeptide repeat protein [Rhodospirillaceae bacterium]MBT7612724.1 tetratricopeptide repeat protein [Rhodospirillaceae bacterium]MBT7648486.1 tetratricopeptide repeat protein [Rhodospirillaceae bacterium]MDG2481215.1 tetratricopeptide repeat protein [Alphaproteobacteria bacterium]
MKPCPGLFLHLVLILCMVFFVSIAPAQAQDEDPWASLIVTGQELLASGDAGGALELFRESLNLVEDEARDDRDRTVSLTSLGLAYGAMGEFVLAGDHHQRALDLRIELYGEPSKAVAIGLRHLAQVRRNQGFFAETSTLFNRALLNLDGIGEGEGDDALDIRKDLASVYYAVARYDDALAIYEELLPAARLGSPSKLVGILTGMAATHEAAERPFLARPLLDEALDVARRELPAPHPDTAGVLNSLGEHLRRQGLSSEALPYYEEALAMRVVLHGETDSRVAPVLNNLGLALFDLGRLDEARVYLDAAFLLTSTVFGDRHPAVAIVLGNLADVLEAQGALVEAIEANRFAMLVLEGASGPNHPDVARLRASFGRRLLAAGAADMAAPELEAALIVLEATYGRQHADVAAVLASQAELARLSGDYELALALNGEATEILVGLGQGRSLDVADLLLSRATMMKTTRAMEEAADLYARVLELREAHLDADNPVLAPLLRDYAFVLRRLKRTEEAVELESRAAVLETAVP